MENRDAILPTIFGRADILNWSIWRKENPMIIKLVYHGESLSNTDEAQTCEDLAGGGIGKVGFRAPKTNHSTESGVRRTRCTSFLLR